MKAIGMYVLIKPNEGKMRKSSSGLEITASKNDRFVEGKVVSIPEDVSDHSGVKNGDKILYDKHSGHDVKSATGDNLKVIEIRNIAIVL